MRKQQSTIAREYLADSALHDPDPIQNIQETVNLIREAQLAALNDGIRIGTEATLKDMRKNVSQWLSFNDEGLRTLAIEFVNSFDTSDSRNE